MELNKIYNMDCLEGLKTIPDNSVDLIFTSPPYNIGIEYDLYDDNIKWEDYYKWCEIWLIECLRILKTDGRIAINHYISIRKDKVNTSPISEFYSIMKKVGFSPYSILTWIDSNLSVGSAWGSWMSASSPNIMNPYEGVLIMYKDQWKKNSKGVSDIEKEDFINLTHGIIKAPTETRGLTKANFSESFANKIIKLLSYQEDLILDPFMGSGTTAKVAKDNNRNFIGFELSPMYYEIALKRLKNRKTKKLFQ